MKKNSTLDPPFPAEQCFTSNFFDKPINNKNNLGFDENDILIYPNPAEICYSPFPIPGLS